MKPALLALLLAPAFALAQHVHSTKEAPPPVRQKGAKAMTTHAPPELDKQHIHALPPGTGPAADGGAWLKIEAPGDYIIHNATVLGFSQNPMRMEGNQIYRVMPHKGPLIWTPPGGKMGKVPDSLLIAPDPYNKPRATKK